MTNMIALIILHLLNGGQVIGSVINDNKGNTRDFCTSDYWTLLKVAPSLR